jgi:hypothetical protein
MLPRSLCTAVLPLLAVLAVGCSRSPDVDPGPPAESPEQLVGRMNEAIDALMARPEHGAERVQVQHILIGVAGALPGVTRTPGESEILAAELYTRALNGEDFDTLERNFSGDVHPGTYTLTAQPTGQDEEVARAEMVAGFGDVAWRLEVGEIGIAPYDGSLPGDARSPFGYHIVKRLR